MSRVKQSISVDFDGVIHQYTSPWVAPHIIPDPPVPGAIEWLKEMQKHFEVIIMSTRCQTPEGITAIYTWLAERGVSGVTISYEKLPALIYLDDRGIRFEGRFPTRDEIHRARPWNKVDVLDAATYPQPVTETVKSSVPDGAASLAPGLPSRSED